MLVLVLEVVPLVWCCRHLLQTKASWKSRLALKANRRRNGEMKVGVAMLRQCNLLERTLLFKSLHLAR